MRQLVVLLALPLLAGCTSTILAEPALHVSPYLAIYELRGKASLQSGGVNPGDPLIDNPPQKMRTFGQDRFDEDVGVRVDLGDGFAGLRADYYKLDMNTSRNGVLDSDWGRLLENDEVRIRADMDELRIGWLEPFTDLRTEYRDAPLRVQLAAGGVFAYRQMNLRGRTDDGMRTQNVVIQGDVLYAAVRARVGWRDVELDVDYAISPEVVLSGDYDGVLQDVEARLSYRLPQRDIRLFAGFRYSELPSQGTANGFRYDADLVLDGLQLGFLVTF